MFHENVSEQLLGYLRLLRLCIECELGFNKHKSTGFWTLVLEIFHLQ